MKFAQALFFAIPFVVAGLIHIIVIKFNLLQSLANKPLDGGLELRGHRIFGKNKTARGAIIVILSITILTLLQSLLTRYSPLAAELAIVNYKQVSPLVYGLLLGIGCIVGELPNSFIKRQLHIGPGNQASGMLKPLFWIFDQVDSLIGVLVCASIVWKPALDIMILLFIITLIIHPLGSIIMISLKLKWTL